MYDSYSDCLWWLFDFTAFLAGVHSITASGDTSFTAMPSSKQPKQSGSSSALDAALSGDSASRFRTSSQSMKGAALQAELSSVADLTDAAIAGKYSLIIAVFYDDISLASV